METHYTKEGNYLYFSHDQGRMHALVARGQMEIPLESLAARCPELAFSPVDEWAGCRTISGFSCDPLGSFNTLDIDGSIIGIEIYSTEKPALEQIARHLIRSGFAPHEPTEGFVEGHTRLSASSWAVHTRIYG